MSNRLFQGVLQQMKEVVDRTIGVIDETGVVISCSDPGKVGEVHDVPITQIFAASEHVVFNGYCYRTFGTLMHPEYAVFAEGNDEKAKCYAGMLCVSLNGIRQYHDERYDRSNFIKNVILDNILPGDIYLRARELHFNSDLPRAVLLIRIPENSDNSLLDLVQSLFPDKSKDFVINVSETDIALVKEVKPDNDAKDFEKLARSMSDAISNELYTRSLVGIGTTATSTRDLARSFKEAQVALEVGKVFDTEKNIVSYEHLGIARLIYQLPTTLCEMFLREIFRKGSIETLDQETLFTIQKFFENNLNVSETSRKLFVHRNTLVYRLEKIKKLTGLDLRDFDDAIVFKVALMVKKYLDAKPVKY